MSSDWTFWMLLCPWWAACFPCCPMPQVPRRTSLLRLGTAELGAGAGQKQLSHYLLPCKVHRAPWSWYVHTMGTVVVPPQLSKKSACQYACLGETPPQLNLLDFVNQCSKQCFSKPPSTVSVSKLKKRLEQFSAVGARPWELQFFI